MQQRAFLSVVEFMAENSPTIKASVVGAGGTIATATTGDWRMVAVSGVMQCLLILVTHFVAKRRPVQRKRKPKTETVPRS